MAKWFLGGELVGGETSWWRDDRIPFNHLIFNHSTPKTVITILGGIITE